MIKKIMVLMIGILLIGANSYAAGDLVVNGNLGAGTSTFNAKVTVDSTDEAGINVKARKSANTTWFNAAVINAEGNSSSNAAIVGLSLFGSSKTIGATTGGVAGIIGVAELFGSGNLTSFTGFSNNVKLSTNSGNYTVTTGIGQDINLITANGLTGNHTITSFYGIHTRGAHNAENATISGTDWRHAYFENFSDYGGTIAKVTGLWIDQQTRGANNYGIVLDGNGSGSNIVFGPNQEASIYSSAETSGNYAPVGLWVKDSLGNATQISPHDPETGEWIYYSKNVKTGRVVRVEMEKLVKAVERLTGEKFMVETLIEDK